jgi:hypothetical protein
MIIRINNVRQMKRKKVYDRGGPLKEREETGGEETREPVECI